MSAGKITRITTGIVVWNKKPELSIKLSVWIVGLRRCVKSVDTLDCVEALVKCVQVAKPLALCVCDNALIAKRDGYNWRYITFLCRKTVGIERVEACVFFDTV